jgi:hypothetical protein
MLTREEKDLIWSSLRKAFAISEADATVSQIEREFRRQKILDQDRDGIGKSRAIRLQMRVR